MLAGQANAQTWTASEVGEGSFYLYNVGAKGYLVAGNNWGTRASINAQGGILTTLKLNDGKYEIGTAPSFSNRYLGFDGYVDNKNANQNWTFEAVEGETNVYKLSTGSGYLFADEGATTTTVGTDPGTEYAYWKLVTRADRIADLETNASKENPIDATFLLTNPNFDRASNTGVWTGGVSLGGNNENFCAEKFNTTFDVYQTVIDAPKGAYALAFQGFYRYGGHGINPAGDARKNGTEKLNTKLYANDTEAPLMSILDETTAGGGSTYDGIAYPNNMAEASTAFSKGLYSTSMDFTVDVNTIKVGVKKTVAVANDWTIFDNARLTYYGPVVDFTIYKTNLATAVANAQALKDLVEEAQNVLNAVVTTYNKEYDSADDYVEAIAAVKEATEAAEAYNAEVVKALAIGDLPSTVKTNFNNEVATQRGTVVDVATMKEATTAIADAYAEAQVFVAPYAAFNAMKVYIDNLLAVPYEELESGAHAALAAAVSDEGLTTVEAINEKTAKMKAAALTYAAKANPTEDNKFDLTFVLSNPDVTSLWTGAWGVQPEGWYNEQNGGNFQVMANEEMGPGGEVFMEYWSPSPAQDGFVLYQKVTLPEGTYQMTGRVAANFNGQGGTVQNVFFAANDVFGTQITSQTLMDAQLDFVQKEEGEVKIGMRATSGNQARWMAINKIQLFKVAPAVIEMKEDVAYTPESAAGTVKLTKTFYKGWNTIVLPFGAEVPAQFSALGGELYKYTGYNGIALQFETADAIAPHTPYLLNIPNLPLAQSTQTITFEDVTVSEGTPMTDGYVYAFQGLYEPLEAENTVITNADYLLGETAFLKAKGGNAMKAFRAYIKFMGDDHEASKENASKLNIVINGETTSIDAIDGKAISNDAIYNLNGVRMSGKLQKGIYIQNGKKVVVK
jgi:hypothetical protein